MITKRCNRDLSSEYGCSLYEGHTGPCEYETARAFVEAQALSDLRDAERRLAAVRGQSIPRNRAQRRAGGWR